MSAPPNHTEDPLEPVGSPTPWADEQALPADDLLRLYLREIGLRQRLSADEERHLAVQLADGNVARRRLQSESLSPEEQAALPEAVAVAEAARQRLVATHLPLVVALARPYNRRGVPLL